MELLTRVRTKATYPPTEGFADGFHIHPEISSDPGIVEPEPVQVQGFLGDPLIERLVHSLQQSDLERDLPQGSNASRYPAPL